MEDAMKHGIHSEASGAVSGERRTVSHNGAQLKRAARGPRERFNAFLANARTARSLWGSVSKVALKNLRELTRKYGLSVMAGDLLMLEGRWYVTHSGLLSLGHRRRCSAIHAILQKDLCDPTLGRWVFK